MYNIFSLTKVRKSLSSSICHYKPSTIWFYLSFQNHPDTMHPSHTSSYVLAIADYSLFLNSPAQVIASACLFCFSFCSLQAPIQPARSNSNSVLQSLNPHPPQGQSTNSSSKPHSNLFVLLIPQPQHMKHMIHCILSDLIMKSQFVLHYFLQESTRKSHFCEIFIYF